MAECLLRLLEVFFSNDVDIKVRAVFLLNDFEGKYIIFLFFS